MRFVIRVKPRHIPKFTRQYGFFTDMSPSSVPHQKLPKGFHGLQFALVVTNVGLLCNSFAALRKSSGPWRPRQGPVTIGSTEQVLLKHHSKVPLLWYISVHCLSLGTPSKWAWHLPRSLNISFLQTVVPKPSLLLHPKAGGGRRLLQSLFVRHHICAKHTRCRLSIK